MPSDDGRGGLCSPLMMMVFIPELVFCCSSVMSPLIFATSGFGTLQALATIQDITFRGRRNDVG